MIDLDHSKLFTPWTNPETGVTIYLMTQKVAPVQEAFYFVNASMSDDARYLWFYCAFPPSGTQSAGRTLGVIDFERMEVRHFPETQFTSASPFVDPITGAVTWGMGPGLWTRGPGASDCAEHVNSLPEEIIKARPMGRIATHLSRDPDGRFFFVDAQIGHQFVFGALPIGGGDFEEWGRFERNHNHAQICPADPNLVLFAEENHPDPHTGLTFPIINRMWLMRPGGKPWPVLREPTKMTHEWWDDDGVHAWAVRGSETWKINIHTQEPEVIAFPHHCWHSHASRGSEYIIGDSNNRFYRGCASSVHFLNRNTGKLVKLVDNPEMHNYIGANYHIDPHPRFNANDQYVTFTTTIRGEVDLAVAKVEDLIKLTE